MAATLAPPAAGESQGGVQTFKFRTDLTVQKSVQSGETSYIIKDPTTRKYFRFREAEQAIFSQLDGVKPLSDVLKAVQNKYPHLGIRPEDLAAFLTSLKKADLLERSQAEKNLLLVEKLRDQRKAKIKSQANPLSKALYLHYHLVDPDRLFDAVFPRIRWMWSRPFVVSSLFLFAFALHLNLRSLGEIVAGIAALYTFSGFQLQDYLVLWVLSIVSIVLHEFGHGLTCKRFGGEVHDLGVLLIFFNPAMYCNVSDAYLFENKRHKLYVTAAGGFVELWIWSAASIVWSATLPGTPLHEFAFMLIVVSGVSTLAFNFNPLLKLDGYYALVDFLGVANLRDNSFDFVKTWIKRNVFRLPVPPMIVEPRLARIYAIYGTLAGLSTGLMLVVMLFLFQNLILGNMHLAGVPVFLLLVYTLYGSMAKQLWGFLKGVARAKRDILMQPKLRIAAGLAGAAVLAAFFFVTAPVSVLETFSLSPGAVQAVRPVQAGRLAELRVREGDKVAAGQVVATLSNAAAANDLAALEARRLETRTTLAQARYEGNLPALAAAEAQVGQLDAAIAKSRKDLASLTLRAPISGIVLTERPGDRVGDELNPGDILVEIGEMGTLTAQISVSENDIGDVTKGRKASLIFRAFPGLTFEGTVRDVAVSADKPGPQAPGNPKPVVHYQVTVEVPNKDGKLKPGMSGEAKIYGNRRPLYRLALHWAGKTFNPDFW